MHRATRPLDYGGYALFVGSPGSDHECRHMLLCHKRYVLNMMNRIMGTTRDRLVYVYLLPPARISEIVVFDLDDDDLLLILASH